MKTWQGSEAFLHRGNFYWESSVYIHRGYIGIMEKEMETTISYIYIYIYIRVDIGAILG